MNMWNVLADIDKLEIIEAADEKTPDNASEHEETLIKDKEGERILKNIRREATVIALAIEGKMLSSEQLCRENQSVRHQWWKPYSVYYWGFIGIIRQSAERSRPASELFKNDVPASIDAGWFCWSRFTEAIESYRESPIINRKYLEWKDSPVKEWLQMNRIWVTKCMEGQKYKWSCVEIGSWNAVWYQMRLRLGNFV